MITLTDRLYTISQRILRGETMADIGTDHGFLPLYLHERGISPHVIMADISSLSLDKARERAALDFPGETFDFRVGDGLAVLDNGEVDAVVMAGIGGRLMEEILEADREKSMSFSKLILQPRRHPGYIRKYLVMNGYRIIAEDLVRESKFIWEIIIVRPCGMRDYGYAEKGTALSDGLPEYMLDLHPGAIEWEVPPYYSSLDDGLTGEFLERKLCRERKILRARQGSKEGDTSVTEKNIEYLSGLIRSRMD